MRQIVQNVRSGEIELAELPAPTPGPGQVLVRNAFSVMSPGTEKLALDFARRSLLGKARSRPDLVRQVVDKVRKDGPVPTYRAVTSRLEGPQPLGYSSAGLVEAVGPCVETLRVGDRVACAGAGYANHAELVVVPENLVARVPDGVELDQAAFATVGAIALQGLRVADPTLGEIAAVVGLGLIGQLAVQLLRANGCRVLGIDLSFERMEAARSLGASWTLSPSSDLEPWIASACHGHGADLVLVTASSADAAPLRLAARLCRRKGRISLVGAVPIEIDRRLLYDKELEIRLSTSYGPGRYDYAYEERGLDYPLAYVRWTERRNLEAFLQLVAEGSVDPRALATETVPFEDALGAYEALASGAGGSLAAVFRYVDEPRRDRVLHLAPRRPAREGEVGLAFVGGGSYARSVLLPALPRRGVARRWVVTSTGASAHSTAARFGFGSCGTDVEAALADEAVDLVFVATRHDSHAAIASAALRAGRSVWLEKPVAVDPESLAELMNAARASGGLLTVGYNRRFSRHARAAREALAGRRGPLALHYTVAAGAPPLGTWILDPKVGGGRLIGEACHFVDFATSLAGALPCSVQARRLSASPEADDSVLLVVAFEDDSTAVVEYLARTSSALPKERYEASADGITVQGDNFRRTRIHRGSATENLKTINQDKGQANAILAVLEAVRSGDRSPIPLEEIDAVARILFAAEESLRSGATVRI